MEHPNLVKEADMVIACGNQSSHGPDNIDELSDFSIDAVIAEVQSYAHHSMPFSSNLAIRVVIPVRFLSL